MAQTDAPAPDPFGDRPSRGPVAALAEHHVERACALDPVLATSLGVSGFDDRLTDYSPEGVEARAEVQRDTLVALASIATVAPAERVAAALLTERLDTALSAVDAGDHLRCVRNIASPLQSIRQVFDLMPRASVTDWELIARRMAAVPAAVRGLRASLAEGLDRQLTAARRQALEAAAQADTWGGGAGGPGFFERLADASDAVDGLPPALRTELDEAGVAASMAFAEMARWLRDDYAPHADERDAVGRERYAAQARAALGADLDLDDTYAWGWDELARIEAEMAAVGAEVRPGASITETIDWLDTDSPLAIEGEDALRGWLQHLMDDAIDRLDGRHFDIPAPVRRVEAMIAPPGGPAAMYYTGPSDDFTRPGRTWYPTLGKSRFPLWGEVSIAYHEGVPGHHLQVGQVRFRRDRLDRFQRSTWVAGHGEGWALYAERLMDELGFLDRPEYRLGFLRAQAMRAVRVIVDLGMHLELVLPDGQGFHPGERWTPLLGQAFVDERSRFPRDFMASEIVRYLGWPAQAISYKVGERVWLEGRDTVRSRLGARFDQRAFHAAALDLGPLGLDLLRDELGRLADPPVEGPSQGSAT